MISDMTRVSPRFLGDMIEARFEAVQPTIDRLFQHDQGGETLGQIMARLGPDHADVRRYNDAEEAVSRAIYEAERRYGPAVSHRSFWPTFLQVSAPKRSRRTA